MLFFFFPLSLHSLATLSSYHAVQGWMGELRVDVGEACKLALVDVGDDQLVGRGQHGLGACEKLVKVFCCFATHFGLKWRLDLPVGQAIPVDASEEGLLPDVPLAFWAAAETL